MCIIYIYIYMYGISYIYIYRAPGKTCNMIVGLLRRSRTPGNSGVADALLIFMFRNSQVSQQPHHYQGVLSCAIYTHAHAQASL